ncbi:MAG: hypothetical protein Homavirus19_1, partial [Homavirus sp.]
MIMHELFGKYLDGYKRDTLVNLLDLTNKINSMENLIDGVYVLLAL